jgi:hypothetical protein
MGPTCTVMVLPEPDKSLAYFVSIPTAGAVGTGPTGFAAPRLLTQPITLIRDLHCIRASGAYFARIKADRATPHPPTPRRPVR